MTTAIMDNINKEMQIHVYAISSTRDMPKAVMFTRDRPKNSGKNNLSHMYCVSEALQGRRVCNTAPLSRNRFANS